MKQQARRGATACGVAATILGLAVNASATVVIDENFDVDDPVAFTLEANDYPYNLSMQEFAEPTMGQPRYQSMNLGRWPRHSYCFEGVDPKVVRRDLTFLKDLLVDKVVPWASQMTPDIVAAQIKKHGEGAWCERRWLEDYDAHLSASAV